MPVLFTSPPTSWFAATAKTSGDWRSTLLTIAMLPLFILILAVRPLPKFFETSPLSGVDYLAIGSIVVASAVMLRYTYKTQAFGRYFGYASTP